MGEDGEERKAKKTLESEEQRKTGRRNRKKNIRTQSRTSATEENAEEK